MNLIDAINDITPQQREAYEMIVQKKFFRAKGNSIRTFRSLLKKGFVKHDPNSDNPNDYVLNGDPIELPPAKDTFYNLIERANKPKFKRPAADHTNLSRDDHVSKWLQSRVKVTKKSIVKVKCLNDGQMQFIMANYEQQTLKEMSEALQVEKYRIKVFCQANHIEPKEPEKKRKPKDDYHIIPPERLQRMKRADYNGPQKKTA